MSIPEKNDNNLSNTESIERRLRLLEAENVNLKLRESLETSVNCVCYHKNSFKKFLVRVKIFNSYFNQIASHCMQILTPNDHINNIFLDYELTDSDGIILDSKANGNSVFKEPLYFKLKETKEITPLSPCNWDESYLKKISIKFQTLNQLPEFLFDYNDLTFNTLDSRAEKILTDLEELDDVLIDSFIRNCEHQNIDKFVIMKNDSIIKAVCLSKKYSRNEAAVDLFVVFLFQRLGFYDERLFAFPQLLSHINYREGSDLIKKECYPDFTIMDVFSFFRMAVVEDKSDNSSDSDTKTEAQLIAEAIAIHQSNELLNMSGNKRTNENELVSKTETETSNNNILGVAVRGLIMTFYIIPISKHILQAMKTCIGSDNVTLVKKMGPYSFTIKSDRSMIIQILDSFRKIITSTRLFLEN